MKVLRAFIVCSTASRALRVPRRAVFSAGAACAFPACAFPAAAAATAAATAAAPAQQFKEIPVFTITTADGTTPLFTDKRDKGAASPDLAFFFAERRDAENRLKKLKLADGDAAVMSVPLSEALDLRTRPAEDLGGSFAFQPNAGARSDASTIAQTEVEKDDLPLFFDPRLQREGATLVFLKKSDLDAAFLKAAGGKLRDTGYPAPRATSVRALAERPMPDAPPFVVVSSEAF